MQFASMEYKMLSDIELVRALVNENSESAFCELYIRYCKKLQLFCLTFIKKQKEAEDIVHDVFETIWKNRQQINTEMSFSSYLYTITRNRMLNFLRHLQCDLKVKQKLQSSGYRSANTIEVQLLDNEYKVLLDKAVAQLPQLRQSIYWLSREECKSHKEIAQLLNISPYTVQENISLALKFIKTYIACQTGVNLRV
jgi:RNA polymerase sigma-70 factor (ECF subfamily)